MNISDFNFHYVHPISQRIEIIMDREAEGKHSKFADKLDGVSYQVISRLFKKNEKSGKYPIPSTSLLSKIINKFTWYNTRWLMTGYGDMLIDDDVLEEEAVTYSREATDVEMIEYWRNAYIDVSKKYQKLQEDHKNLLEKKIKNYINDKE